MIPPKTSATVQHLDAHAALRGVKPLVMRQVTRIDVERPCHAYCVVCGGWCCTVADVFGGTISLSHQPLPRAAAQRLRLSARAFHYVLKPARTIANLAGTDTIAALHIAEARQCQPRVEVR